MGRRSSERSGRCTGLGATGMCRVELDRSPDYISVIGPEALALTGRTNQRYISAHTTCYMENS